MLVSPGENLRAALASLDEIHEQAAEAGRALKAAIGGRKAPAAPSGGLRERVLAHMDGHPQGEFTPHEIHKVLGNSAGAIANALDTLVKLGEADLVTDHGGVGQARPPGPDVLRIGQQQGRPVTHHVEHLADEPLGSRLRGLFQRAGFLEQMGRARNDGQFLFADELRIGIADQHDHHIVIAPDAQHRR